MTLEADLYTELYALCPRVFPDNAPLDTTRPYITWQQIGGEALAYFERSTPTARNARIQINVYADTRVAANTLALAIEDALTVSTRFQAKPESALLATRELDFDAYGTMQDFNIWAQR